MLKQEIAVVWFKRDLRFTDHEPLFNAQNQHLPILLIYCFEPSVMNYDDSDVRHWRFVYQSLQDMQDKLDTEAIAKGVRDTGGTVTLAMYECKKPIIGAINGAAVGIGATMTCAMDIRLASDKARVGFVFNKIGITPEACSSWFLPRLVGLQTALEW